jgi:methyl-accepting chemotaxis protein
MRNEVTTRAAEREELLAFNRRVMSIVAYAIGPVTVASYLAQALAEPRWQFWALVATYATLDFLWVVALRLNRRGRLEASAFLSIYGLLVADTLALALRQGVLATAVLADLCALLYSSALLPRRTHGPALFAGLSILALRAGEYFDLLPQARSSPGLLLAFDLTIIGSCIPMAMYLLRLRYHITELPYRALRTTAGQQEQLLEAVARVQPQVDALVRQGEETARSLAAEANRQATTGEQVGRLMRTVQGVLDEAAATAHDTRSAAGFTGEEARHGSQQLSSAAAQLAQFQQLVEEVRTSMQRLSTHSERTEDVIAFLSDVDEQLNMLAVNAALEAARAGEAGKGFGAVAAALREMLASSAQSIERGKRLLATIRDEATRTLEKAEQSAVQLRRHVVSLGEAQGTIERLDARFSETASKVGALAKVAGDQQSQVQQIARTMDEMRGSAHELTRSADALSQSLARLSKGQDDLRALIERRHDVA